MNINVGVGDREKKNSPKVMRTVMGKKRLKEMNAEVKREKRGKSHAFSRSEKQEDDDDAARPGDDADEDQTSLADGEKWNSRRRTRWKETDGGE